MNLIHTLTRQLFRFIVVWVLDGISLLLTAAVAPGIGFASGENTLVVAASAAFLLGIVNLLIRPLILLLALPFGFIAIFVVGFSLNALGLWVTANLVEGFFVQTWADAIVGSLILAIVNTLLTSVIAVDDDDSFYQNIAERLAKRDEFFALDTQTQGIVMMEIDGLSYHHIKRAIDTGWMPTLKAMRDNENYVLSRFDCGLPSQTSACQAGIMFGNNFDIPAFRWYDKDLGRLIVSGHDAPFINSRVATGNGLMRAGSSVNNMMNGDALVSVLTLADLFQASEEQQKRRTQDFYILFLNPYFFLRTLVLYFGDVVREVYEGIRQQLRRQAPRLNRLAHFYPFIRAATTVLMRDISASLTILDIVRGTPALYVTWPGYDEVAHHSGPWTHDAFHTLRQYDHVIRRVRDAIARKAPRPYELIILSDHGQSYGWTFKQRYGKTLRELIEELTPGKTNVSQTGGGDDGMVSVRAMTMELDQMQNQNMGGRIGKRVIRGTKRAMNRGMRESDSANNSTANMQDQQVAVCASGNLAQVYFLGLTPSLLPPPRLALDELNEAYPNLLDGLVKHEGIGIVMAYNAQNEPLVFGKNGARNLATNAVTGQDPLTMYGDADLRAAQLKRLAEFPHNGDLTIISTYFQDGTVAAMEELVGNHGGLGGEQTDAFIFHPNTFTIPETSNSADVFHVLNARREIVPQTIAPPTPAAPALRGPDAWNVSVLWQGLLRTRMWFKVAVRALLLDVWAFRQAATNAYLTAPALLIAVLATLLASWVANGGFDFADWLTRFISWFVGTLVVFGAARLLRGTADFTTTLRAVGFAQIGYLVEIFAFVPPLALLARVAATFVTFLATWIAVGEAHRLRGWRVFLLPFAALAIAVAGISLFEILLRGTALTIDSLAQAFGVLPR